MQSQQQNNQSKPLQLESSLSDLLALTPQAKDVVEVEQQKPCFKYSEITVNMGCGCAVYKAYVRYPCDTEGNFKDGEFYNVSYQNLLELDKLQIEGNFQWADESPEFEMAYKAQKLRV